MKKIFVCLSALAISASIAICLSDKHYGASSSIISDISDHNVEVLADGEVVDMEKLRELANQPIWAYMVGVWAPGDSALRCITGGSVTCPMD